MGHKWASLVMKTIHIREPTTIMVTQEGTPCLRERGISYFHLKPGGTPEPPKLTSWGLAWQETATGRGIIIDAPMALAFRVQRHLEDLQEEGMKDWQGPLRSPLSAKDDRWYRFRAYWQADTIHEGELAHRARTAMRTIPGCTAASMDLYEDPNCWVLEGPINPNLKLIADMRATVNQYCLNGTWDPPGIVQDATP